MQKLHILAIAAHPDDVELSCAGTLIKHVEMGHAVGILDLTEGELGTRGTVADRYAEAAASASLMGVRIRENAKMSDGFFMNDEAHQRILISYIRFFQPDIVITNALDDRHPDHGRAAKLVADSCFLAGLRQIKTDWDLSSQEAWRPKRVYHMIQDRQMEPTFAVDITSSFAKKMDAIRCFKTQFFSNSDTSGEPTTYISTPDFMHQLEHRDAMMGKRIGVKYAEGFVSLNLPGISDLDELLLPEIS